MNLTVKPADRLAVPMSPTGYLVLVVESNTTANANCYCADTPNLKFKVRLSDGLVQGLPDRRHATLMTPELEAIVHEQRVRSWGDNAAADLAGLSLSQLTQVHALVQFFKTGNQPATDRPIDEGHHGLPHAGAFQPVVDQIIGMLRAGQATADSDIVPVNRVSLQRWNKLLALHLSPKVALSEIEQAALDDMHAALGPTPAHCAAPAAEVQA